MEDQNDIIGERYGTGVSGKSFVTYHWGGLDGGRRGYTQQRQMEGEQCLNMEQVYRYPTELILDKPIHLVLFTAVR